MVHCGLNGSRSPIWRVHQIWGARQIWRAEPLENLWIWTDVTQFSCDVQWCSHLTASRTKTSIYTVEYSFLTNQLVSSDGVICCTQLWHSAHIFLRNVSACVLGAGWGGGGGGGGGSRLLDFPGKMAGFPTEGLVTVVSSAYDLKFRFSLRVWRSFT